jgi:hypothetical protein
VTQPCCPRRTRWCWTRPVMPRCWCLIWRRKFFLSLL